MRTPAKHNAAIFEGECRGPRIGDEECNHRILQPAITGGKVRHIRCKECGRINRMVDAGTPSEQGLRLLHERFDQEWMKYYDDVMNNQ